MEVLGQDTDESGASFWYGIIAASYAMMQFIFSPILGALSDRFGQTSDLARFAVRTRDRFHHPGLLPGNIAWLFLARIRVGDPGSELHHRQRVHRRRLRRRNAGAKLRLCRSRVWSRIHHRTLRSEELLGDIWTKRLPFFVAAGLSLINWLYGFFVLPESLPPEKRGKLTFKNANPFASIRNLRRYPLVFGLSVVFTIKALAQRGLENTWVLFGSAKFDWSLTTIGLTLLWVGITTVIVQGALVRPVVKRFGERRVLLVATLISSSAFFGYAMASQGWMVFAIISFGALGGLAGPAVQSIVTRAVDETEQGQIQGALTQLQSVASIISPILFTTLLLRISAATRPSTIFQAHRFCWDRF